MEADLQDLLPSSRGTHFSMVMTELHQKFTEENIGVYEDDSRSWIGCDSANGTTNVITPATSSSAPEFRQPTTTRERKPRHGFTPTMGPICAATIQLALISLRPVPHPADFPTETTKSLLSCPTQSPASSNSITNDDSEVNNQNVLKSIKKSRELTRSANAYLKSVNFMVESQSEQEYEWTSQSNEDFQPEKEDDVNSIFQRKEPEPIQKENSTPQPPEISIKSLESCGSGDQLKDQNQPRETPSFLEQILEAKKILKAVKSGEEQRNSEDTGLQDAEIKGEERKKSGLFSWLKFWKKQPKTNQYGIELGIRSSEASAGKDKKTSRRCRLFCCFQSSQVNE
ncbi:hypothetical protein LOTGIDRAFT_228649 [Lottia gigantea]|uniref:Uncharacterized protein n=1 Tax=Lottia gigantea TaxID=225164 RepID=V4AK69_LOTGI|nr:hypothetical protein LOTGIDRAFT_228649 [Lottia gigantea]ESO93941.1 hypothetical protein LOTGIDRAFT_228649 [Lottia gigantea]